MGKKRKLVLNDTPVFRRSYQCFCRPTFYFWDKRIREKFQYYASVETIAQRLATYDRALTTEELATIWCMRPWTVRQWLRTGKLVGYRISNEWRVDAADAIEFWEKRRTGK